MLVLQKIQINQINTPRTVYVMGNKTMLEELYSNLINLIKTIFLPYPKYFHFYIYFEGMFLNQCFLPHLYCFTDAIVLIIYLKLFLPTR